jgi:hypothetical protein
MMRRGHMIRSNHMCVVASITWRKITLVDVEKIYCVAITTYLALGAMTPNKIQRKIWSRCIIASCKV